MDTELTFVPFFRPSIGPEEIAEVTAVLQSGWLTTGPRCQQFEQEFADYLGVTEAVAVNSCTAALHLALEAIGVQRGDLLLVPTMTFAATAEVVRYFGATPVLIDCDPGSLNLDLRHARVVLDRLQNDLPVAGLRPPYGHVRAIIPVHYGGQMVDVAGVRRLAARNDLYVIEDAAHALPAAYRRREQDPWLGVGTTGEITCFSFYANKTITTGEGGMAVTNNPDWAARMRVMRLHGISKDAWKRFSASGSWYYEILAPGFKYNMTDMAAALGIHQLRKASRFRRERARVAAAYTEALQEIDEVEAPTELPNRLHSWHLYPIQLRCERLQADRAQIIEGLRELGVGTAVHWMPLHMHPYYRETYGYTASDLPNAAAVYPRLISLPIFPSMSDDEAAFVVRQLKEVLARARVSPSATAP